MSNITDAVNFLCENPEARMRRLEMACIRLKQSYNFCSHTYSLQKFKTFHGKGRWVAWIPDIEDLTSTKWEVCVSSEETWFEPPAKLWDSPEDLRARVQILNKALKESLKELDTAKLQIENYKHLLQKKP